MTVQITAAGDQLDSTRVLEVEERLRITLPSEYREFLLQYNLARPADNVYRTDKVTTSIRYFFGVSSDKDKDLVIQNQTVFANRLPKKMLAIAYAGGGDLVCLRTSDGSVYLWDHEREAGEGEEPRYENMARLASSFPEFLAQLQPYRATDFPTNPSQVKSVKLKPGFQEKFKKYM
jgi:hypothetical protein